MEKDCAIIIAAKDSYAEIWPAFFKLFFKYWSDCPFEIFMLTEKLVYDDKNIKCIPISVDEKIPWDKQWGSRMKKVLKIANKKYFIFLHTDYFLKSKIDNRSIFEVLNILDSNEEIGYVRLCPDPQADLDWKQNKKIGLVDKQNKFSLSLQAAIWRTDFFEKILQENWGPADLETIGSKEAYKFPELLLSVRRGFPILNYVNGIKKGVYQYEAKMLFRKENVTLNSKRLSENLFSFVMRKTQMKRILNFVKRYFDRLKNNFLGLFPDFINKIFIKFNKKNKSEKPEEVFGHIKKYFFGVFAPMQIKEEFLNLLNVFKKINPKTVVEIGTANGGTLFCFANLAKSDATIVSIDLPGGKFGGGYPKWKIPFFLNFKKDKQKFCLLRSDSHTEETLEKLKNILQKEKIDFLFIDGDHSYNGVKKDFEMYSPLVRSGGIIAFHDITPNGQASKTGGVPQFWKEIKDKYNSKEFIKDINQTGLGIGYIIFN